MQRNLLYISYLYPPLGGRGLPGAQRSVKFVRYLECDNAHVLTVNPEYYPENAILDNNMVLPINNEIIHRTKAFDIFKILLKIKSFVRSIRSQSIDSEQKTSTVEPVSATEPSTSSDIWYEGANRSMWQQLKDFISNIFYFPDNSSPWIIPAVIRGLRIIKEHKISVIFATGNPWSALVTAYILSKITGVSMVVDFRDPWIENPFHVSKGKILDDFSVKLEKAVINQARLVSANTEELKAAFLRRYPNINPSKFIALPNGYNVNDYQSIVKTDNSPDDTRPVNELVMAHAGFLYGTRDPLPIIRAIEEISKTHSDLNVIFWQIGKISLNYDFYGKFRELLDEGNVVHIEQLPYDKCLERLSLADVLLNIQPKTMTQVPSKIYDYLCMDMPILTITPLEGALGNMIRKFNLGDVFAPEDVDGIASCIIKLWQKKQRDGSLAVSYPNRELFDVRRIACSLSESLKNIGI